MTATTVGGVIDPRLRSRLRRWWPWLLLFGLALGLAIATAARPVDLRLDPDNGEPAGARALAQVLGDKGVSVTTLRQRDALTSHRPGGSATLVVVQNGNLTLEAAAAVRQVEDRYANVVLVGVNADFAEELGLTLDVVPSLGDPAENDCDDPMLGQVRSVSASDEEFIEPGASLQACLDTGSGWLLLTHLPGGGRPRIDFYAHAASLSNDRILAADDALMALRLLSRDPQLVWFSPEESELVGSTVVEPDASHLPAFYQPLLVLGLTVAAATMFWRGRRLGRLVVEPLPVTIRATETTRSRGRLYSAAGDNQHSLAALQAGARARLAKRLSVPAGAEPTVLVTAVSGVSGRHPHEVNDLLFNAADRGDEALVALANALADLEEEC